MLDKNAKNSDFNNKFGESGGTRTESPSPQLKKTPLEAQNFNGEGRPDVVARLCMVVDWCIDHPEYTAKIKVIPKKDYPILMPCEFWGIHIQAKRFELLTNQN